MKRTFTIITIIFYTAAFGFFLTARTLFDAAWMIAVLTIPVSSGASVVSRLLADLFGNGHNNICVDLAMLFIFGLAQYALLGWIIGWTIDRFRKA